MSSSPVGGGSEPIDKRQKSAAKRAVSKRNRAVHRSQGGWPPRNDTSEVDAAIPAAAITRETRFTNVYGRRRTAALTVAPARLEASGRRPSGPTHGRRQPTLVTGTPSALTAAAHTYRRRVDALLFVYCCTPRGSLAAATSVRLPRHDVRTRLTHRRAPSPANSLRARHTPARSHATLAQSSSVAALTAPSIKK